ncbi:putative protein phosphatase 2C 34 [Hibiscus syriacus]|uniref:RING-type domain-containing protein n=1 Tax=Hibiscus syriacus TaxID=106335 RepID=A0A6A3AX95_HIBSY|nr:putative protein phosphatase 2C 34 [Hibiscus syriacus]
MTSASELFYTRRSRVGRPDPDSGTGSSIERNHHRRNHLSHHHNRHDLDGGDSLAGLPTCATSARERPSVRFDEGISELVPSNGLNADTVNSSRRQRLRSNERRARARFDEGTSELVSSNGLNADGVSNVSGRSLSSDERLPGAVLLARERLLERLRGVSVSGNRQNSRNPHNAYHREHVSDDDLRSVTELSTGLAPRGSPLTSETESQELDVERTKSRESRDCSICLESFGEGDVLTRLRCGHRFHFACLDPWVRTCGDCPYCRRKFATEQGGLSADVMKRAFNATEEEFLHLVKRSFSLRPQIESVGSCCLVGAISNDVLYVANLGDSRAVLGKRVSEEKVNKVVAERLSTDHNVGVEEVRKEVEELHPDDSHIAVYTRGVWRIEGIIQVYLRLYALHIAMKFIPKPVILPTFHEYSGLTLFTVSCSYLSYSMPSMHEMNKMQTPEA